jgi:hypothetical protein
MLLMGLHVQHLLAGLVRSAVKREAYDWKRGKCTNRIGFCPRILAVE